jgi:hypothetical protein
MLQVFPEPDDGEALGGSNIADNHAGIPCEKSLPDDTHAALECHRLHSRY